MLWFDLQRGASRAAADRYADDAQLRRHDVASVSPDDAISWPNAGARSSDNRPNLRRPHRGSTALAQCVQAEDIGRQENVDDRPPAIGQTVRDGGAADHP